MAGMYRDTAGLASAGRGGGEGVRSQSVSALLLWRVVVLMGMPALAQVQQATLTQTPAAPTQPALRLDIPHSNNPFNAYRATLVPQPNLANSPTHRCAGEQWRS